MANIPSIDSNTPPGYGGVGDLVKNENVDITHAQSRPEGEVPADADAVAHRGPPNPLAPM